MPHAVATSCDPPVVSGRWRVLGAALRRAIASRRAIPADVKDQFYLPLLYAFQGERGRVYPIPPPVSSGNRGFGEVRAHPRIVHGQRNVHENGRAASPRRPPWLATDPPKTIHGGPLGERALPVLPVARFAHAPGKCRLQWTGRPQGISLEGGRAETAGTTGTAGSVAWARLRAMSLTSAKQMLPAIGPCEANIAAPRHWSVRSPQAFSWREAPSQAPPGCPGGLGGPGPGARHAQRASRLSSRWPTPFHAPPGWRLSQSAPRAQP